MTAKPLGAIDKLFVFGETRETMMHVAGLMIFTPPADARGDFISELVGDIFAHPEVVAPWNLKLATPTFGFNPMHKWIEDEDFDLDYHVRHSALPSPGGERELGKLVSRLHSHPVDFHRPPWELHIIEGLAGGRFALYLKVHHSLVDGYSAMKIIARALSTTPKERTKSMYFALPEPIRETRAKADSSAMDNLRNQAASINDLGKAMRSLLTSAVDGNSDLKAPMQAPACILNNRIGRNRRFATQQVAMDRLRALADAAGGTLNDVVIALCAASLRQFLAEMDELPEAPLVAYLPVNIRPKGDQGGGNAIGAILVSMATDQADPVKRLTAIIASTTRAKEQLKGLSQRAILEYSAMLMLPYTWQLAQAMTGNLFHMPVNFNLCISNVPGPETPMYLRGARLDAIYPVSIPAHGMALNITVQSYAGYLDFGFVGCRDTLPHLQNLAVYTGEAVGELEKALLKKPAMKQPSTRPAGAAGKAGKAVATQKTATAKSTPPVRTRKKAANS